MAQSKPNQDREATRKETSRRRRDQEMTRRVMFGLVAVGVLLVLLIGAGIVQELVIKPSQPVATVNGSKIGLRDYQKRVKFDWYRSGQAVTDPQGTSLTTLDSLVDDQLLREQAQQRGITVTADEIDEAIEKSFGYLRVSPTPAPTHAGPRDAGSEGHTEHGADGYACADRNARHPGLLSEVVQGVHGAARWSGRHERGRLPQDRGARPDPAEAVRCGDRGCAHQG